MCVSVLCMLKSLCAIALAPSSLIPAVLICVMSVECVSVNVKYLCARAIAPSLGNIAYSRSINVLKCLEFCCREATDCSSMLDPYVSHY